MYIYLVGNRTYQSDLEASNYQLDEAGHIVQISFPKEAIVTY